jgi:hypothetical protein
MCLSIPGFDMSFRPFSFFLFLFFGIQSRHLRQKKNYWSNLSSPIWHWKIDLFYNWFIFCN